METPTSFAPLAGRLAAQAAELRPAEGSRDNLAKFMALVVCALLDMLVLVCEMLDARAAIGVRPVAAFAPPVNTVVVVLVPRAGRLASPGKRPMRALTLVPEVRAVAPRQAATSSETTEATTAGAWLAPGRLRFGTVAPLQNAVFRSRLTHDHFVTIT